MTVAVNTDEKKIAELLTRSVDKIYPSLADLEQALKSGRPLRVYVGIDPTATYIHLGHATNYLLLKRLHQLGHKIIILIGDFTALIGDPSDKTAARQALTRAEVEKNMESFKDQIGSILDFSDQANSIEFVYNSNWLTSLNFSDLLRLASNFTVQQMIERDIFAKRLKEQKPLYLQEFFYPLMQGYDSVALEADLEIGGTDQTFNMLAGRTLVKNYLGREKFVLTTTLLVNPKTGEKLMSKSLGTGIALTAEPNEMFGQVMALPDEAVGQCLIDCTELPLEEIKKLAADLKPRDLKLKLAYEIVKLYQTEKLARAAEDYWVKIFSQKDYSAVTKSLPAGDYSSLDLVAHLRPVSKSEAMRLIGAGALEINGKKITDPKQNHQLIAGDIVSLGKKDLAKVEGAV